MNTVAPLNEVPTPPTTEGDPQPIPPTPQEPVIKNPNHDNPNPYLRRYGSHVKSHFSQSRCEFFESSDEEKKPESAQQNTNNVNSLDHIKDIRTDALGNVSRIVCLTSSLSTRSRRDSLPSSPSSGTRLRSTQIIREMRHPKSP